MVSVNGREVELRGPGPQAYGQSDDGSSTADEGLRQRNGAAAHSFEYEDEYGLELSFKEQEPLDKDEQRWALYTVVASGLDLLGSGVIISTTFKYAFFDGGVSLYSLGCQAVSHWLSSLLLVLRFGVELRTIKEAEGGVVDTSSLLLTRRRSQLHREQCISITMAIIMLFSSVALLFKAFRKLRFWNSWYEESQRLAYDHEIQEVTAWLAWTGFSIYVLQAIFRVVAARKLKNCLCTHGCVASFVSLVYLLVLGIAASYQKEWTWKAEPIAAICLVVVMLIEGIRITFYYIDDMDSRLADSGRA
eukprot:TRINITY_DN110734_c0_g1_i1.p1 TRINITY_DN110734_c0_g1~~TRINITY_DN110734_c0_g1_i1.p1  ORF type:complete len:304 (-),score=63.71 TRINITY_DN110734_c0_g1_i1:85-996(-)